jgi:hypothetical protein
MVDNIVFLDADNNPVEYKKIPINNFSHYTISNDGTIENNKNKIIKQCGDIYKRVLLNSTRQKSKNFLVHRLVALSFIPKLNDNKNLVNHINGIKSDNRVENLEWVSHSENSLHSVNVLGKKYSGKTILQYDKNGLFIAEYKNSQEASIHTNVSRSNISKACTSISLTSGGFIWKFKDQKEIISDQTVKTLTDIPGYNGKYKINKKGQVYSKKHNIFLKPNLNQYGYSSVTIFDNDNKKNGKQIHILVALTFIPNLNDNKKFVNHINGIKSDNRVENLEWVSHSENMKHACDLNLNKCRKRVKQYDLNDVLIKEFNSIKEAKKSFNTKMSGISLCCNNRRKTCGGFKWKFSI